MAGAIGSPAANAGAMGSSAVGAKITQTVFGRRDRQPGSECRRDRQLCSWREDNTAGAIRSPAANAGGHGERRWSNGRRDGRPGVG